MRKQIYPKGKRGDRIANLLEYVASHPGCTRANIQGHMDSLYGSALAPQTTSKYVKDLIGFKAIDVNRKEQFFITEEGKRVLESMKQGGLRTIRNPKEVFP